MSDEVEPFPSYLKGMASVIWDSECRTRHVVSYEDAVEILNRSESEPDRTLVAAVNDVERLAKTLDEAGYRFSDHKTIVALLATEVEAGHRYAESIGLREYQVFTEETADHMQGRRIRAVVITPGYLSKSERAVYEHRKALGIAEQSASLGRGPRG